MTGWLASALQILLIALILVILYAPLGDYLARTFTSARHSRAELAVYRLIRVDPDADQRWSVYLVSVLAFGGVSVLLLLGVLTLQGVLPLNQGHAGMPWIQALNIAISFVTNTNWQSYAGEAALGAGAQAFGLTVQNFASAAVGLTVAIALTRAFVRQRVDRLGNFWVDLTRAVLRVLLPASVIIALLFVGSGVIQNLSDTATVSTLSGGSQSIPGGLVASQEAIKQLGTNGGGFFNANSAHPFENPTAFTNLLQIALLLLIPIALPRTFGRMVGDLRQGRVIAIAMAVLLAVTVAGAIAAENAHHGAALDAAGASLEGKETRFGVPLSAVFAISTTMTSTGAVNSMHSSFTGAGGGLALFSMMLGEVSPGGVGSGLYGMLILALVTVFLAGLMVGRTPMFLGKRIGATEMKLVGGYLLLTPTLLLLGAGVAMALPGPRASILNAGSHGLSEVVYAFASASNNNGSAFAGLNANTDFYNIALAVCMALARFGGIAFVLALAGVLAQQGSTPPDKGTLPTRGTQFGGLLVAVTVLVAGLTYLPALALGPLAEALA